MKAGEQADEDGKRIPGQEMKKTIYGETGKTLRKQHLRQQSQ